MPCRSGHSPVGLVRSRSRVNSPSEKLGRLQAAYYRLASVDGGLNAAAVAEGTDRLGGFGPSGDAGPRAKRASEPQPGARCGVRAWGGTPTGSPQSARSRWRCGLRRGRQRWKVASHMKAENAREHSSRGGERGGQRRTKPPEGRRERLRKRVRGRTGEEGRVMPASRLQKKDSAMGALRCIGRARATSRFQDNAALTGAGSVITTVEVRLLRNLGGSVGDSERYKTSDLR